MGEGNDKNAIKRFTEHYLRAILEGYTCFYIIPSAMHNSQYLVFLLSKTKANKPFLRQAQMKIRALATKHGINDQNRIQFAEIREHAIEPNAAQKKSIKEDGCWHTKGFLADCGNAQIAQEAVRELRIYIRVQLKKKEKHSFCRLILSDFGDLFIRIQNDPNKPRPAYKNQPQ